MCIKGELHGEPGKGCTSPRREGISFIAAQPERDEDGKELLIRLDKKGRLVLPLEIRDSLGIKPGDRITLSISYGRSLRDGNGEDITIKVAKAPPDGRIISRAFSRNGSYVEKKQGGS